MEKIQPLLSSMIFDAIIAFVIIGAVFALAIGLLMLLSPGAVATLRGVLDKRYSGRRAMKPMEIPRNEERRFYRRHQMWGLLIVMGATFYLLIFFFDYNHTAATALLSGYINPHVAAWLADSGAIILTVGNVLALLVGLIILIRPSLLKGTEGRANRWLSTRKVLRPVEDTHYDADAWFATNPRLTGGFLLLGSLFILASFGLLWFR
ncbi:MAG TPA: hypothetical protein VFP95_01595 [Gammaproteobacteria bacterium]|nr:hypothetical protein [Gammaproteobacteria bacterium]